MPVPDPSRIMTSATPKDLGHWLKMNYATALRQGVGPKLALGVDMTSRALRRGGRGGITEDDDRELEPFRRMGGVWQQDE